MLRLGDQRWERIEEPANYVGQSYAEVIRRFIIQSGGSV
jgi:hypothetical protein